MKTLRLAILLISAAIIPLLHAEALAQGETLRLTGLKGKVTVYRDQRSIPYIQAENDEDLYLAQGFVTASDRLWQMDLLRRVARGETAEIFGPAALEEDKRWRRFGFAGIAEKSLAGLSPEVRIALQQYSNGVNAFIAGLDEKNLPAEFKILQYKPRAWTPADTVVIGKILADALSTTWRGDLIKASLSSLPADKVNELLDVRSEYDVILFGKDEAGKKIKSSAMIKELLPADNLLQTAEMDEKIRNRSLQRIGLFAEELAASNNWVISGKRTADGKPLLANDPHLRPSAPGIWYIVWLKSPGVNVAGVTVPGAPGVILGHNAHMAWGATNVGPDVQDLYIEKCDSQGNCLTPTGNQQISVRVEKIAVRKGPGSPETEIVEYPVKETRNGVVILEQDGKTYSLKWTARDPKNDDLGAFYLLNRAKNWDEFNRALASYRGPTQNFVYADSAGNIGWHVAGSIPIRRKGDGSVPYEGSGTDGDWIGDIPFSDLPMLYNPPAGFIVTANQRIVGTDYKYPQLVRQFAAPWRARRLYELLNANPKATIESVREAQHDVYNIPLSNLSKAIIDAKALPADLLSVVESWDGKMVPESRAALLTNEIAGCLADEIAKANKPAPSGLIRERILDRAIRTSDSKWLPSVYRSYPEFLSACGNIAVESLTKRFGQDRSKWVWGAVSVSSFPHPLASVPFIGSRFATPQMPIAGSGQTPNVGSAVSMRLIAVPGNWDQTEQTIPLGQSGDPASVHFRDQFDLWKDGIPAVFPFTTETIKKLSVSVIQLVP